MRCILIKFALFLLFYFFNSFNCAVSAALGVETADMLNNNNNNILIN
jgi:hypothetical protein